MKKTFTINLGGTVFHIDDDAHEKLNSYFLQLNRHFGNDADGKEIVQDIESRISELFTQKLRGKGEVITIELVEEVIETMGMPEAFSVTEENEEKKASKVIYPPSRKLYRDPDDRVLGGVCSGLGAYFGLDPVAVRILFILLVILGAGAFLLVYIILWIVVPKAKNTAERLEMQGKEVNITNISHSIKEEIQDVKDSYRNFRNSRARQGLSEIGNVLTAILKIAVVVIGGLLVAFGVLSIVSLIFSLFAANTFVGILPWASDFPSYLGMFVDRTVLSWFWIGVILFLGIPMILVAYLGLKLLFRFKTRNNAIGLSLLGLWIIGIFILIFSALSGYGDYKKSSTTSRQEAILTPSDTLYLQLGEDEFRDFVDDDIEFGNLSIASMDGNNYIIGRPEFDIESGETDKFTLLIRSKARGNSLEEAQSNARQIDYNIDKKDSLVTFQPWYVIPGKSKWRAQEIDIVLKVPEGKTIFLSDEMEKIIHDIENTTNTWDGDMGGKYWTMTPDGLAPAEKNTVHPRIPIPPKSPTPPKYN